MVVKVFGFHLGSKNIPLGDNEGHLLCCKPGGPLLFLFVLLALSFSHEGITFLLENKNKTSRFFLDEMENFVICIAKTVAGRHDEHLRFKGKETDVGKRCRFLKQVSTCKNVMC